MSAFFRAALALSFASVAFPQSTKLQVRSATVDLDTHEANIELFNSGDKTVAAYTLEVLEFNAAGKQVFDKVMGFDNLYYPDPGVDKNTQRGEQNLIHPGGSYTYSAPLQPETVTVKASIVSVVNEDRTVEGNRKSAHLVFVQRKQTATKLRQAIQIVSQHPTTPEEFSRTLQKLRSLNLVTALGVLANQIHLSATTFSALIDNKQPLPAIELPTRREWGDLVAELSTEAAYFEAQSEEATQ